MNSTSHIVAKGRWLFAIILLLMVVDAPCDAQWEKIAPGAIGSLWQNAQEWGGAMVYSDGMLWAGKHDLRISADTGVTWRKVFPRLKDPLDVITDISAYDRNICAFCTINNHLYITVDGGNSWKERIDPSWKFMLKSIAFTGSPLDIIVTAGTVWGTHDGGITWQQTTTTGNALNLRHLGGGIAYGINTDLSNLTGNLIITTDRGVTWRTQSGIFDLDSYSLAVSPSNPASVFIVNEDALSTRDSRSSIYHTCDTGNTWTVCISGDSRPADNHYSMFVGSISTALHSTYVQTHDSGIYRSTDLGVSWKPIGGPSGHGQDTRFVLALSDNFILAVDTSGSIWRTLNSGGDSVTITSITPSSGPLSVSDSSLFAADTILVCDSTIRRTIKLSHTNCDDPVIESATITGAAQGEYDIIETFPKIVDPSDSITILFHPSDTGRREAECKLRLSTDSIISVTLGGVHLVPSISTADVMLDTIGQTISIPITIVNVSAKTDIEFMIGFDPMLTYRGTFSRDGTRLDILSTITDRSARVKIPANELRISGVSAYSEFEVFPDTLAEPKVWFDSLRDNSTSVTCSSKRTSRVLLSTQCGMATISKFLHLNIVPVFSITPNPSSGKVEVSCNMSIGNSRMLLIDEGGTIVFETTATFVINKPQQFMLPLAGSGKYQLSISSASGTWNRSIILLR